MYRVKKLVECRNYKLKFDIHQSPKKTRIRLNKIVKLNI